MSETLNNILDTQWDIEDALEATGGELTPEIQEALDKNSDTLQTKVDNYNLFFQKEEAKIAACDQMIKFYQGKKKTFQNSVKGLKGYILYCMKLHGITKLEGQLCKARISKTSALEVDEDKMLAKYRKQLDELQEQLPSYITIEVKINKTEAKRMIKESGLSILGAELKENETLIIQ